MDSLILTTDAIADPGLLAENLKVLSEISLEGAWLGIAAYTLHIYLDFSAYSDMAIGMGRMIGLHYLENFNYPYISRSVTEFWRRWHMSLGTFFRDYVYIPLGGNRCSFGRMLLNTLVVWALTGLWHGASWNFVIWGLWSFVFLMVEKFALKKWLDKLPVLPHLYLIVFAMLGWVIFRFTDIRLALELVKSLSGLNGNALTSFTSHLQLQSHLYLLLVSCIACTPFTKVLGQKLGAAARKNTFFGKVWDLTVYGLIPALLLLASTACLVGDSYNPFIYFQF